MKRVACRSWFIKSITPVLLPFLPPLHWSEASIPIYVLSRLVSYFFVVSFVKSCNKAPVYFDRGRSNCAWEHANIPTIPFLRVRFWIDLEAGNTHPFWSCMWTESEKRFTKRDTHIVKTTSKMCELVFKIQLLNVLKNWRISGYSRPCVTKYSRTIREFFWQGVSKRFESFAPWERNS